jgi:hypothetical protein
MSNVFKYSEDFMDQTIDKTLRELYARRINNDTIRLTNFSFRSKSHLAILNIARIAHNIFNLKIEISTTPLKFFWYNLKYKFKSYCARTNETEGIDTEEFMYDMQNTKSGAKLLLFYTIYEEYYERKKNK